MGRQFLKLIKYFIIPISVILIIVVGTAAILAYLDGKPKYATDIAGVDIPTYSELEMNFSHIYDQARGLPYAAAAIIDVDNDGVDELFLGGGARQSDALFKNVEGNFINVIDDYGLVKQGDDVSLGASVIDADYNGFEDLVISRESGIWLYLNQDGKFRGKRLEIDFHPESAPLGVAIVDINRDGYFDFFVPVVPRVSPFEWLSSRHAHNNIQSGLYLNNGDNTFADITEVVGLGQTQGAIQAVFADLNADGLEDLTVLQENGQLSTWKNLGNLLFERLNHYYSELSGEYMGLASGDFNGDGNLDMFLSNRGTTIPEVFSRFIRKAFHSKYSKWILLNNIDFFTFKDEADTAMLAGYELGRGAAVCDLNGDGREDLVVSQNHPYWPPYLIKDLRLSGRVLLQGEDGQFRDISKQSGVLNKNYSVVPLFGDFNNDGRPDIVFVNIGGKSRIYMSSEGKNNFLRVKLPESADSLGAVVRVKTLAGKEIRRNLLVGRELCADSSHTFFFGLGEDKATDVFVEYTNGKKDQRSGVLVNTDVVFERLGSMLQESENEY